MGCGPGGWIFCWMRRFDDFLGTFFWKVSHILLSLDQPNFPTSSFIAKRYLVIKWLYQNIKLDLGPKFDYRFDCHVLECDVFPQQKKSWALFHCLGWSCFQGQSSTKTSLDWGSMFPFSGGRNYQSIRKWKSTTWTKLTVDLFESCFFFLFPHGLSTWIFVTVHSWNLSGLSRSLWK